MERERDIQQRQIQTLQGKHSLSAFNPHSAARGIRFIFSKIFFLYHRVLDEIILFLGYTITHALDAPKHISIIYVTSRGGEEASGETGG